MARRSNIIILASVMLFIPMHLQSDPLNSLATQEDSKVEEKAVVSEEKMLRDIVSQFFKCYETRDFEALSQLVDWDSPIIPRSSEGKQDVATFLALAQLNPGPSGEQSATIVNNMDEVKKEFERYPYGWIKADIKEITRISETMALVIASVFECAIDSRDSSFFLLENNNYRIVLIKQDDKWRVFGFGFVFDDIPHNAYYLSYQGEEKLGDNKIDESIRDFKNAIALKPDLSYAHFGLALAYTRDPHWIQNHPELPVAQEAFKEAKKAIELRPEIPFYHYFLGMFYHWNSEDAKAKEEFDTMHRLDPFFPMPISDFQADIVREKISSLKTGMSRGEAVTIMGNDRFCDDLFCVENPLYQKFITLKTGITIEVQYYITWYPSTDSPVEMEKCIPVVFKQDALIGWGMEFLKELTDKGVVSVVEQKFITRRMRY